MRQPLTRLINAVELNLPCKITWVSNDWYIKSYIPSIVHQCPEVSFDDGWFGTNFINQYLFTQTIMNVFTWNNIDTNDDDKIEIYGNNDRCDFIYKIPEGQYIVIPRLPIVSGDTVEVVFTLNEKEKPILKISAIR